MRNHILAIAVLLTACSDRGSRETQSGNDTSRTVSAAPTFAAALGVDLATMARTGSGAYYRDVTVGTGTVADSGKQVALHYRGQLPDGTQFDARQPPDEPISFRVATGAVVRGFDEGTMGMRAGGRRLVVIPPELGYGAQGNGPVPPNAYMVFTIDLVSVRP